MSNTLKGFTINEGYTDLGDLSVNIGRVENPILLPNENKENEPQPSRTNIFRLVDTEGNVLPNGMKAVFKVNHTILGEETESISYTGRDGFVGLDVPTLPVIIRKGDGSLFAQMDIKPLYDARSEECYLAVLNGKSEEQYTLSGDLGLQEGRLGVYTNDSSFFRLSQEINVASNITALYFTKNASIYGYNITTHTWTWIASLNFTQIQYPENLVSEEEGIYKTTDTTGILTTGLLGTATFAKFSMELRNPGTYYYDLELLVYEGEADDPIYNGVLANLKPGDLDYRTVTVDYTPTLKMDDTPTLGEIETVSGTTFSPALMTFLEDKELTTLGALRKMGPVKYINDIPGTLDDEEVALLQSHIDLYTINTDTAQNQKIISAGYGSLYSISLTAKNTFINDVTDDSFGIFKAAQIHEISTQQSVLFSNIISTAQVNSQFNADWGSGVIEGSSYGGDFFANFASSCSCEDCKSAVSPFAYLVDLIKYSATHVKHTPTGYSPSHNYGAFLTLMTGKFYQLFGQYPVKCDLLHDEYCRVRLVTEILEAYVDDATIIPSRALALAQDRKKYLQLTYSTLLSQAGTSVDEVRDTFITVNAAEKEEKALKLSSKLGIPLKVSGAYTTDSLWLYFTASYPNPTDVHDLNASNLEKVFGFRDTKRDILEDTPVSLMETWREIYLRQVWKNVDYPFTAYTRESSPDLTLVKKPIMDPDIISMDDMPYFAKWDVYEFYAHRKRYVDTLVNSFVTDNSLLSQAKVNLELNKLQVTNANIIGHIIEGDVISMRSSDAATWTNFGVLGREQNESNVVFTLNTAPLATTETNPAIRYRRRVEVKSIEETPVDSDIYTLKLNADAVFPLLSGPLTPAYARLIFIDSDLVEHNYDNTAPGSGLTDVSFVSFEGNEVKLTFNVSLSDPTFSNGSLYFVYEVEVSRKDVLVDPQKLVQSLFLTKRDYQLRGNPSITPIPTSYLKEYWVWETSTFTYGNLKTMYAEILVGDNIDTHAAYIENDMHMTLGTFNRMMQLFEKSEVYLNDPIISEKLSLSEQYELASIIVVSAKANLHKLWVEEENTQYFERNSGSYLQKVLRLDKERFRISVQQPILGIWDKRLQASGIPIIDPQLLKKAELPKGFFDSDRDGSIYMARELQLASEFDDYMDHVLPPTADAFEAILNRLANNNYSTPYNISPFLDLKDLADKLNAPDYYTSQLALEKVEKVFGFGKDDFIQVYKTKIRYEEIPLAQKTPISELKEVLKLCLSAYKRKRLYPTWKTQETTSPEVEYFRLLRMKLPEVRGNYADRAEWQRTLQAWSRQPFIDPDFVRPENIVNFLSSQPNMVRSIWKDRQDVILPTARLAIKTLFDKTVSPSSQWTGYRQALITYLFGYNSSYYGAASAFFYLFADLQVKEEAGEDIRPLVEQCNITMSEYRTLRKVYDIIEDSQALSSVPLGDEEYEQVYDILLQAHKLNVLFPQFIWKEFQEGIILSGQDFVEYKPAVNPFPLTDLPQYNATRAPFGVRKEWFDLLESRNERKETMKQSWDNLLSETEDRTLRVLRDGLLNALARNCESLDSVAERIARTLFIETKDNCCTKHTRISFAIETLQKFVFALKNGIYDDYLNGFALLAPNFDKEWEWIGSYATWRAAVFTWLYPENLLYPTLKRLQSPGFRTLTQGIQDSNRLSPAYACQLGKDHGDYLSDMMNLEVKCTVTVPAETYLNDADGCCGNQTHLVDTDFYFAQSKVSGKSYWSSKKHSDSSASAHGFWELIPEMDDVNILGCFPLPVDRKLYEPKYVLWLFYTYRDKGELKMAYRKRNVDRARTGWSEHIDADDIPAELNGGGITRKLGSPYSIIACQSSIGWDYPGFIFSYNNPQVDVVNPPVNLNGCAHFNFRYLYDEDKWDVGAPNWYVRGFLDRWNYTPLFAVRHSIEDNLYGISVGFEDQIITAGPLSKHTYINAGRKLCGLFQSRTDESTIVWVEKDAQGNNKTYQRSLAYDNNGFLELGTIEERPNQLKHVVKIAPVHSIYPAPYVFAIKNTNNVWVSCEMANVATVLPIKKISLMPEKANNASSVPIQSADCITDFSGRALQIKNLIETNQGMFAGIQGLSFTRSATSMEYVKEAYYFVPMLLALDQQQRGQYDSALDWFRSVYDYARFTSQRKIYYGLKQEESLVNVYNRPSDWLMDPLNPHLIGTTRRNAYTRYTMMNIIQCLLSYADQEFTIDTIESVPRARVLYSTALELIESTDLKLLPNACTEQSLCLHTQIGVLDATWSNLTGVLAEDFASLNNVLVLNPVKEQILEIFNNPAIDYSEKFSQASLAIENAKTTKTTSDVSGLLAGHVNRFSEAMSYMNGVEATNHAANDIKQYVNEHYASAVAQISGLEILDLETEAATQKLGWLTMAPPPASEGYKFGFASNDGVQHFTGDRAYNPLSPTQKAFEANVMYSNAVPVMGIDQEFAIAPMYTPVVDFIFCIPRNPVYNSLELKANLELYKIFNCRNIAGMVRELDVYAAPTDSVTGIPVIGAGGNLILPGLNKYVPSQYRFNVLLDRAKQIASQAQQLESLFLSTLEKLDAENYNQLKARQDLQTAKSTIKLQDLRVRQANSEYEMAGMQLEKVSFMEQNFENLLSEGLLGYEMTAIDMLTVSFAMQLVASSLAIGSVMTDYGASSMSHMASSYSTMSSIMSQMASYQRRAQEWDYQRQLAGFDIKIANQQIKIAEDNIRIISQERQISQLNADHAQDTLEFLRNKFTNAELYNWMGNVLERSYAYMLNLATSVAKTAEGQLYFERQEPAGPFILDDYWETAGSNYTSVGTGSPDRRGLTGSARLLQDIYRLDQHAFETDKRKLQLTKTISLAQNFPVEFQRFRETGVLNFELTNRMVDYDFPGHYLRLIRSVKTTVVGLVPVYGAIKASLTAESTSYTVVGDTLFQRMPIKRMDINTVALTSPNNSNGLFEMQQVQSEMLNPFEGMGFESRWEFKMPRFSNRMEFDQVADVLINVEYTALDSFQYRYQVLQEFGQNTEENTGGDVLFSRAFSFKNNFPDQWFDLSNAPETQNPGTLFGVTFKTRREDFPAGFNHIALQGLTLCFVREEGVGEINVANFNAELGYPSGQPISQTTVNGMWGTAQTNGSNLSIVLSSIGTNEPFVAWKLEFANTPQNRQLFSQEKIKDILFVLTCKGDLPAYPL